jgi:asparagine synthase (glutamine-hydrolysing)
VSTQAGLWNFDGAPVDQALLERFRLAAAPYGPDGTTIHAKNSVGIIYGAFHTTDESRLECQPFYSPSGKVIVWNGRLDNRCELIAQLNNELGGSDTDVAIVGACFERFGTDCFRSLVGDWAASIWNAEDQELILAVDYMAIRHLFYRANSRRVWWSTEITPLVVLAGERFSIDDPYIAGYLVNDPDSGLTPYSSILQVPAGHFVRIHNTRISLERYWRFDSKARISHKTDAEYEEHFRHLFRQAVRRRIRSVSPILAELSGGLDSSSMVRMADDILARREVSPVRLDTLSLYDRTEPDGDDWLYVSKIEENRGRRGFHFDVSRLGNSFHSFQHSDFRPFPGHPGTTNKIGGDRAQVIRSGNYRVLLSGIGGDEFMGGIPDPSPQLADRIVRFELSSLTRELAAWSLAKRRPWIHLLLQAIKELVPPSWARYFAKEARLDPWLDPCFAKRTQIAIRQLDVGESVARSLPIPRYYLGGQMRMANMLAKRTPNPLALQETRYPFLDQNLLEFVTSIPRIQLIRPGERRSLMRRALAGLVPQEILLRPTKQFAARTPMLLIEKNWAELEIAFRSSYCAEAGFIDAQKFLRALNDARQGNKVHLIRILKVISLEFWLRDLVDRGLLKGPISSPSQMKTTCVLPNGGKVSTSSPSPGGRL